MIICLYNWIDEMKFFSIFIYIYINIIIIINILKDTGRMIFKVSHGFSFRIVGEYIPDMSDLYKYFKKNPKEIKYYLKSIILPTLYIVE
jgi:hypothetical protein